MKEVQRDYMFKVGNEIIGVGIMVTKDDVSLTESWFDYDCYVASLKDQEDFYDYTSSDGGSETDSYSKKKFIKKLKSLYKKGEFLGIVDYYAEKPKFIKIK